MINAILIVWLIFLTLMCTGCATTYDYATVNEPSYSVWISHGEVSNGAIIIRSQ